MIRISEKYGIEQSDLSTTIFEYYKTKNGDERIKPIYYLGSIEDAIIKVSKLTQRDKTVDAKTLKELVKLIQQSEKALRITVREVLQDC